MDIDQLREVIVLAEKKNYAVAAEQLFISQSALSRHIVQLEDKLGVQLFERNSRKVSLTRYGEALIPFARKMIALEDESIAALDIVREQEKHSIKLGSVHGLSTYGIMDKITGFISENRDIALSLFYTESGTLKEMLSRGMADLIIVCGTDDDSDSAFRRLTLCEDRLVVVLQKDHPLAKRRKLTIQDLANEEWIIQEDNRFLTKVIKDVTRGSGVTIKKSPIHVGGVGPLELAAQGLGITMEQELTAKAHPSEGLTFIPLDPVKIIKIELLWSKQINEPSESFAAYMRKHIKPVRGTVRKTNV